MSKSLSESAAEILNASLGAAKKDAMPVGGAQITDLGGQTPTTLPTAHGAVASAQATEAPKPGQGDAPKLPAVDPVKKKKQTNDVGTVTPRPGTTIADQGTKANEETEEDEVELTEEEMDEYLDSLSEEELEALAAEVESLDEKKDDEDDEDEDDEDEDEDDEDEDEDDEDEDDDKKKSKKDESVEASDEPVLTEEEIAEARKQAMKKMVTDNMGSCKEDIDALFSGESLSEEFKTKATTIFEAAVRARVETIAEKIAAENETILEGTIGEIESQLTEQVDEYLNYVVEQWLEDNELAVETGLRAEIAEDFMAGLKNLFLEHYIEIPEDKVSLVDELADKVAAADAALEEQVATNKELTKKLNESTAQEVLRKICEGLTEIQVAKIKSLAEGVEFTTEGEYSQKLAVIRENYFPSGKKVNEAPVSIVETEVAPVSGNMDRYVNAITKIAAK